MQKLKGKRIRAHYSKLEKDNWPIVLLFIAPQFLLILLFYIWPMIYSVITSFTDWNGVNAPAFTGLANYVKVFSQSTSMLEMRNTCVYAVASVPLTLILSTVLANTLNKKVPCRGFFRVAYFLPAVTMPVAVAMVWRWLLNTRYGIVNDLIRGLGFTPPGWLIDPKVIMTTLVLVTIWMQVGYNTIILLAGLQGIGKQYYEAAEMEGAGELTVFFRITVPLLSPVIFFLLIMMTMGAFKAFDIIYVFSGVSSHLAGGPLLDATRTMVFGIYQNGFSFMRMGFASAQATVLFIIIMIITVVQFKFQDKWVYYD